MLLFSDKQTFFHKNKKKEKEKMWPKMNVCLSLFKNRFHLSWVKHSEQLHYGLCFCKVCVFAFISEFCSIE